jgi:hypothetical protein
MPLPGDEIPLPETDEIPLLGSGFNFLNAPSARLNMRETEGCRCNRIFSGNLQVTFCTCSFVVQH